MKSETLPGPAELDAELAVELRRLLAEQTDRAPETVSDEEVREAHRQFLAEYGDDLAQRSLQRTFERQVEQRPGEVAVLFGGKPISYAELDRRANRLARFLCRQGVGPETLVGVCLQPSTERVVALLGILKAGGAFVPIAPGRRGTAMRAAARPACVLSAEPLDGDGVIVLPQVWKAVRREDDTGLEEIAAPENLAAVVEDGSGRLVLVERRHLLNRLERLQAEFELGGSDVLLHSGGEDADWEIFWSLLHGGRLLIAAASPAALGELGVTILRLTPARLAALLANRKAPLGALRVVLCGGEALRAGLAASFAERSPARLVHFYSPTGAAAEVSFYTSPALASRDPLPVGDTFNLSVLLLDPYLQPVPPGLPGEIHLTAPELPRGFLGDPCATALSFIPDPFAEEPGSRLLRTGDLGRLLSEGALALAGAAGRQVWIGGRRLDLGAVEAALLADPSVAEAAVLVRETTAAAPQLVAYLVVSGAWAPERHAEQLRWRWPDELLPAAWVPLSRLPLTPSGRLDEVALLRLPVIDGELAARWEESLRSLPEVEEAAVLVGETSEALPPVHLDDLLPGWKSTAAGAAGRAGDTAGGAGRPVLATAVASGAPSVCHGPALTLSADAPTVLAAALERAARKHPENGITYLQGDGSDVFQSYPELLETSQRLLAGLRELGLKPQDKVLFQLDGLQNFVVAFWASMLGGFVPVPLSIAPTYEQPNTAVDKLANAWRMLDRPLILCGRELLPAVRSLSGLLGLPGLRVEAVDDLCRHAPDRERHACQEDDLALLLLTSGSTGLPKAVMQTHRALLTRSAATAQSNAFTPEDVSLNWMPLDHVGGIVMFHLRDVYVGCRQIQAPTAAVLADPLRWLDWIERFRATITWAPNFAFGLVNDRAEEAARRHWDLASMRFILNGGEAIVARTARTFLRLLEPHGLPGSAMKPAWGMSETCSGITFSHDFNLASIRDADPFVEVGLPVPEAAVRIVDAENRVVTEDTVGRLQVKGPMITAGYYQRPDLDAEVFTADGWFDTGDLGVLSGGGRLSITGRANDVIIIHGVNYYSHEIEAVVEEIPGVEVSYTAACPVREAGSNTDELAIFFHTPSESWDRRIELIREIRNRVAEKSGLNPTYVIPMTREEIPKTAIGKIQRAQLRQQLEAGTLADVLKRIDLLTGSTRTLPAWFYHRLWQPREPAGRPAARPAGRWLVFLDPHGLGADLCRRLERRGQPYIAVEVAQEYIRIDARRFALDPGEADHYRRLLQALASPEEPIDRVVHLWTWGEAADEFGSLDVLERVQERGVYSLLFLVQALVAVQGEQRPVDLAVISSGAQITSPGDRLAGAGASLPGLLKTIPLELPAIHCRHIDLELGRPEADVRRLLWELDLPAGEAEIAYRGNQRLVPALASADLLHEERGGRPITPGGLYLITGGLGGIGSRLARLLHEAFGAPLLLIGRTSLPEPAEWPSHLTDAQTPLARRISSHLALERAGVDFTYRAVDVVDEDALKQAVAEAETTWQRPLSGIFHLAGEGNLEYHWTVSERHWVATESRQTFEKMFAAKVYGTWTLSRLLADRPQMLFVAFSSVNSLFGGSTFSAYSAANSFLDAYMLHQRYQAGRRAHCFNWSVWDELGMSHGNPAFARDAAHAAGYHILSPERGFYSLLAGLERGEAQLIVGLDGDNRHLRHHILGATCDRRELNAFFTGPQAAGEPRERTVPDRFGTPSSCKLHRLSEMPRTAAGEIDREQLFALGDRPAGPAQRVAPRTEIERQLVEIWQQVLGTSPVGIHDNFFHLGGDSILSIQILARAAEKGLRLTPKQIFQHPTIAELAAVVEIARPSPAEPELVTGTVPLVAHGQASGAGAATPSDFPLAGLTQAQVDRLIDGDREIEDVYPLSPTQQGMLFHTLHSPELGLYFDQMSYDLKGALDVAAFVQAWQTVVDRHAVLRTGFAWQDSDRPLQVVHRKVALSLRREDWRRTPVDESRLSSLLERDRELGFDLGRAPLMRLMLIQLEDDRFHLVWSSHHILLDGWAHALVLKEVFACYEAGQYGRPPGLLRPFQYRDYIAWLERQDWQEAEGYWRRTLAGFTSATRWMNPGRRATATSPGKDYAEGGLRLAPEWTARLQMQARRHQLTLNTLVQGAWGRLLSCYSGEDDVVFGATSAGRPAGLPGVEAMVGLFINTLPVRMTVADHEPLLLWLQRLQEQQLERGQYEHTPLAQVQRWSEIAPGQPLFEILYVFENLPVDAALRAGIDGLEIEPVEAFGRINYPLSLAVTPGTELAFHVYHDTTRFDRPTVRRLLGHLSTFLAGVAEGLGRQVGDVPLLSTAERHQLLLESNDSEQPYPRQATVSELFARQAERTPEAVAVEQGERRLTYRELAQWAGHLAARLRSRGVGTEVRVGLCVSRTVELAAGALAILEAGGAYVPLDPELPQKRLAQLIAGAGCRALLGERRLLTRLPPCGLPQLALDGSWIDVRGEEGTDSSETAMAFVPQSTTDDRHPLALAYVMHTSGSTGTPKGVAVPHRAVLRLALAGDYVRLGPDDRMAQLANVGFDATTFEIWGALLAGARVVEIPREVALAPRLLAETLRQRRITAMFLTAALFHEIAAADPTAFSGLKHLLVGGQKVELAPVQKVLAASPPARLLNGYGPTESTTFAAWYQAGELPPEAASLPIGGPLANTRLYVLDPALRLLPWDVQGELFIGGDGLARGYLGDPALTAERFLPDPMGEERGCRLYRTGDRVRRLADGSLEFLGRFGDQVKIRGFRIEPAEVEAVLTRHPAVRQAAVVAQAMPAGETRLVAYVAGGGPGEASVPTPAELRIFLGDWLPEVMVPSWFVVLDVLPLTANGKVDRVALPTPDWQARAARAVEPAAAAPESPAERQLAAIWSEVLGVERVGLHDNFFALGGDSILAIQIVSRAHRAGLPLSARQLFEHPTPAELASVVEATVAPMTFDFTAGELAAFKARLQDESGGGDPIEAAYPLSPMQHGMLFYALQAPASAKYFEQFYATFRGAFDPEVFGRAWQQVIDRTPELRTAFAWRGLAEPMQVVYRRSELLLDRLSWLDATAAEQELRFADYLKTDRQRGCELSRLPLMRFSLIRLSADTWRFVWAVHHLLIDGWSVPIVLKELFEIYEVLSRGQEPPADTPRPSYRSYIAWLRQQDRSRAEVFWRQRLAGFPASTPLGIDQPPGMPELTEQERRGEKRIQLDAATSSALRELARHRRLTLNTLILGAWALLLASYSGTDDVVFGTTVSGRPPELQGVESMLGMLINTLPLRVRIEPDKPLLTWLAELQAVQVEAREYEYTPLVDVHGWSAVPRGQPLFESLVVFENAPMDDSLEQTLTDIEVSGVGFFSERAAYPLAWIIGSFEEIFVIVLYDRARIADEAIAQVLEHWQALLREFAAHPDVQTGEISVIAAAERQWKEGLARLHARDQAEEFDF